MKYKALLIDLDGVIRKWHSSDESIEGTYGLPIGSMREVAFSPELIEAAITGAISDEEWRARITEKLGHKFGAARAADAVAEWASHPGEVDELTLSLLSTCHSSLRLVLVTNATSRLPRDLLALGLSEHFHAVVNSSQVGVAKPSNEIFRVALERSGATPAQALFIDDTAANVESASSLGILSHAFIGHQRMSEFLHQAGVLRAEAP
jgi:putative hydrolase of the HAD superfamily